MKLLDYSGRNRRFQNKLFYDSNDFNVFKNTYKSASTHVNGFLSCFKLREGKIQEIKFLFQQKCL